MQLEELFLQVTECENLAERFVKTFLQKQDARIFLFGAGCYGDSLQKYFIRNKLVPEAIVDNFKTGTTRFGIPIIPLCEVQKRYNRADCVFIIGTPDHRDAVKTQLLTYYKEEQVFDFCIARYCGWSEISSQSTKAYILSHKSEITDFYHQLSDGLSKETLLQMLLGHVTGETICFSKVRVNDMYYPKDLVQFNPGEVMVELGSMNGETLLEFIRRCPEFESAYCFEPDLECLCKLQEIEKQYQGRITVINKGAWDKAELLHFEINGSGGDGSSKIVQTDSAGDRIIATSTVDAEVKQCISYIKMDIEGAELRALKGAEQHIKMDKPTLAISIYHKDEDIIEIPRYLKGFVPTYRFFMRHHGPDDTDTILYAKAMG